MLQYKTGDILKENAEALVNTVNCVGVMGRGIALQFKKAYPENFKKYAAACKKGEVLPGKMFVVKTNAMLGPKYIINFPTKRHWRGKSKLEDIESGLNDLLAVINKYNIHSIAIPPLGSGLGGLNWFTVKSKIEKNLSKADKVDIIIYEPTGSPDAENITRNQKIPHMTAGRAALIKLIQQYLSGLLDPQVSLLEIHKLMYFMQETGEPLRLIYKKAEYGPYADNLRHVLNHIEGYYLTGYADGGDNPTKTIELVPGAGQEADSLLDSMQTTDIHLQKVTALVDGFESPFGLELLSSVHWVITREDANTRKDVTYKVHNWSGKKKKFSSRQISIAIETLGRHGLIEGIYSNKSMEEI